ncbi:MAG: agmatinase family protein [Candidatus Eisenbacteria bacterium]|nr:agmatinase family protein [Candidatus Eisenbacteria bacterium]
MKKEPVFLPFNFGALEERFSSLEASRAVVLPVPYDSTASYQSGSKDGPQAIISASRNMELFDEELGFSPCTFGIHTLPFLEPVVSSPEDMVKEVTAAVDRYVKMDKFVVMLGGDHILSVGAAKAFKRNHRSLGFVQLDAHADMRSSYEGTRMNHACTGRRLAELGPLVQVGVRSMSEEESEFLKRAGADRSGAGPVTGRRSASGRGSRRGAAAGTGKVRSVGSGRGVGKVEARPGGAGSAAAGAAAGKGDIVTLAPSRVGHFSSALAGLPDEIYLTIDMDVFDPSVVPSVGTPEPGGLSWQEVTGMMRELAAGKRVVGMDLNELRPIPGLVAPDFLAARLVYRLIGSFIRGGR